eukprot:CAMPEP_0113304546 /NCGR_PEP_ID=MMETSP0010_2-20120614/4526_1 /TAXON_ID=216773 ORGANISM="Corethron hystrix, Strain 308" /NCGR_SAMPLE_ID=MMETSP0010_2 /ASSEMBLY_ACC=CAM_ASM_000155 /LENGTH=155 /DNA_ID=CAMNT_0000158779 /DNA_START=189 /DNA_END=653 /DNA_ORIENTATION=+ /assembly_acc=CAM_ASM_000155
MKRVLRGSTSEGEELRANFIAERSVTLVVHSPLVRARETCEGMLGYVSATTRSATDAAAESEGGRTPSSSASEGGGVAVSESGLLLEKTPSEWVIPGGLQALDDRIQSFESWLASQDGHSSVAVVGHSQYFKRMLGLNVKFGNCEVWQVDFDPNW